MGEWNENDHPRNQNGTWTDKEGRAPSGTDDLPADTPFDPNASVDVAGNRVDTLLPPTDPMKRTGRLPKLGRNDKSWTICRKIGSYLLGSLDDEAVTETAERCAHTMIGDCGSVMPDPDTLPGRVLKRFGGEILPFVNEDGEWCMVALGNAPKAVLGHARWLDRKTGDRVWITGVRLPVAVGADTLLNDMVAASGDPFDGDAMREVLRELVAERRDDRHVRLAVMLGASIRWPMEQRAEYQRHWLGERRTATVFVDKKQCDRAHMAAAAASPFARDFCHVEIDDEVDLDRFDTLCREYERLRDTLPAISADNAFRFRFTGRHRATGVYNPAAHAIAVDPRHPESTFHEMTHAHDAEHDWMSLSGDFRPLIDAYRDRLDLTPIEHSDAKVRYALTPTEILSRAAETWAVRHGVGGSFVPPADDLKADHLHAPLFAMADMVDDWFDAHPLNR